MVPTLFYTNRPGSVTPDTGLTLLPEPILTFALPVVVVRVVTLEVIVTLLHVVGISLRQFEEIGSNLPRQEAISSKCLGSEEAWGGTDRFNRSRGAYDVFVVALRGISKYVYNIWSAINSLPLVSHGRLYPDTW